jgi:transposase
MVRNSRMEAVAELRAGVGWVVGLGGSDGQNLGCPDVGVDVAHGFRPVERDQQFLLPPDLREWLPDDHLAWLVIEAVELLDLSEIEVGYRLGGRGRQAYHPRMLTALLLYAYAIGERSSRRIERACHTDVAFRVVAANQAPDHATIARFRTDHQAALVGLHAQVLGLCATAGLIDPRVVAVDSTKVAANASGAANRTREQLEKLAEEVFGEAAAVDAAEDARFGDRRGDEPAPGFEPGPGRAARIREALRQLDEQAIDPRQQRRDQQRAERIAVGKKPLGRPRLPADPSKRDRLATKQRHRKANLTDPDSRMMKAPGRYVQGYSCQAIATRGQIVLAGMVTNEQNDNRALRPMLDAARRMLDAAGLDPDRLRVLLADKGYWNHTEIEQTESDLPVTTLVSTVKDRALRSHDPLPEPSQPTLARMHRRLQHPTARRFYKRRSVIIEPIFGQRKTNRRLDRFLRRGLDAVNAEWTLEITAHNLTKLHQARLATP